jgi:hypothetical protein
LVYGCDTTAGAINTAATSAASPPPAAEVPRAGFSRVSVTGTERAA